MSHLFLRSCQKQDRNIKSSEVFLVNSDAPDYFDLLSDFVHFLGMYEKCKRHYSDLYQIYLNN